MKQQLKHTILISISLLMMLSPSLGQTQIQEQKTWLVKNQRSPFEGILLDEATFRSISKHLYMKSDLQKELDSLKIEHDELKNKQDYGTVWFIAGVVLGGVVTYSVAK